MNPFRRARRSHRAPGDLLPPAPAPIRVLGDRGTFGAPSPPPSPTEREVFKLAVLGRVLKSETQEVPPMTDQFLRVDERLDRDPIDVADPIIRSLDKSGRAGMLEAIATTITADDATNVTCRTSARWLRIIAAREKRA